MASSPPNKLHVLIVPGSWHVPAHASRLVESLKALGIPSTVQQLPTCSVSQASILDLTHPDLAGPPPATPWPDMFDDARAIQTTIRGLVDADNDVLLVAHSYGGLPSSEAVVPELCRKNRRAQGQPGGLVGFFALVSFFLPPGMSTIEAVGGKPLPETPKQPSGLQVIVNPQHHLFNDLDAKEQEYWTSLLRPQAHAVHECKAKNPGHTNLPCGYLKTLNDNISPMDRQLGIIKAAEDSGISVEEYSVDASHEAYISQPDRCAIAIADFAGKCLSK